VDQYATDIFENLLLHMTECCLVTPGMQFVLATRHLERIADHARISPKTSSSGCAGLDVPHGRG